MTYIDLFQQEREQVFDRCWAYFGHESEVENAGDYRRRTVAGRPLFFARGEDGQVQVFLNSCPHRAALICRREEGNVAVRTQTPHGSYWVRVAGGGFSAIADAVRV